MGKLRVYNFVTLNGYFKGADDDISWAKNGSKEEQEFAGENAKSDGSDNPDGRQKNRRTEFKIIK